MTNKIEQIFEECVLEIVEKNGDRVDLTLRLGDFYDINLAELEPEFTDRLYKEALKSLRIRDGEVSDFYTEGNKLNKTIEITIKLFKEEGCKYCNRAREHAQKHGKDDIYILCKAHRVLKWYADNAYHKGNVTWRNPASAESYNKLDTINIVSPRVPNFGFSVIAEMDANIVEYDNEAVFIKPVIVSNVDEGEYINRRFAVIFAILAEEWEWGILENNVMSFVHYMGLKNMHGIIDTCTWGKAVKNMKEEKIKYFEQRISCENCEI